MANTLTATSSRPPASRWLVALGVGGLLVVLLLTAGGLWLRQQSQTRASGTIETDLLALVQPRQVAPVLALMALADYPADQVWQEPLRQGQWHGALALWLFGPVRADRESAYILIELADAQRERDADDAAAALRAAADVVRLSPELSDRERAELLVMIGKKLRGLGLASAAVTEWQQASILAHYGPSMPALYRATLLQDLAVLYKQVGARSLEARAREDSAQVGATGELVVPDRIVLDTEALPAQPPDLQAARDQRRAAAEAAARALGTPDEAARYADLRNALSAEGLYHRTWITNELRMEHPREVQAALLVYHINWLQRERLLAWGFGGPHFPTWVERRARIEQDLHDAWDALELVRLDQSIREGVAERATLAQRDWWARRLVQARLSRDPGLDVTAVVASMVPNNADQAGGALLRLDWIQGRFWRVPREYVGTNQLPE